MPSKLWPPLLPDGSVFLMAPLGTMTLSPHVYKNLRYDPFRDFIPVASNWHRAVPADR